MGQEWLQTIERLAAGDISSLDTIIGRDDAGKLELDKVTNVLDTLTRKRKVPVAGGLQSILEQYSGPATPVFLRLAVHLFDAAWFEAKEKRAAIRDLLSSWRHEHVPALDLFRGGLEINTGQRADGLALIEKAARESDEIGLPRRYVGAYSVRVGDEWLEPHDVPGSHPITWIVRQQQKGRVCVMVAADANYYIKFGAMLHASLREHDTECNIHFHVLRWVRECSHASTFRDDRTSISAEAWPYPRDFTYFATARFYRAAEFMREFDQPLYITDIDNRFSGSPTSILPELEKFSAGFRYHSGGNWFPWFAPSGGNVWLRNDEQGRQVADLLHNYIAHRFRPNVRDSWWFDQLALNEVRHHALQQGLSLAEMSEPRFYISAARPDEEVAPLKSKY